MSERKIAYETQARKSETLTLVRAPSLQRLFVDCALSLTDQLARLDSIQEVDKREAELSAPNQGDLLVKWLQRIVLYFETDHFLAHRIVFKSFDGKSLVASLFGEEHDPIRHGSITEIPLVHLDQLELGEGSGDPEQPYFARISLGW